MVHATDILEKIKSDFGEESSEVIRILNTGIIKWPHLHNDRIIRCLLFLADKNISTLYRMMDAASSDPRDVMYWAEYIHHDQPEKTKQIRDFTRPFTEEK